MKQDNFIQSAIDESLSGVHFSEQDARNVLLAVRNREGMSVHRRTAKPRFAPILAMAMTLVIIVPIGLFALRAKQLGTTRIAAAPGAETSSPIAALDPYADIIVSASDAPSQTSEESEVIRIARKCFESVCDTSIFSFEEYSVNIRFSHSNNEQREYTVDMTSIYGNGCAFSVTIAMPQGEVTHYTTPSLATIPTYMGNSSLKSAWYTKYGPYLITWPQDAQAEFSRRYEGAMLRTAKEGEIIADHAVTLAKELIAKHLPTQEGIVLYGYAMLYSERAGEDGLARYVVSVYPSAIDDTLPELLGTVSFSADGGDVIVTIN